MTWKARLKFREGLLAHARRQEAYWSKRYHALLDKEHGGIASPERARAYRNLKDRKAKVADRERLVVEARKHVRPSMREHAFAVAVACVGITEKGGNNRGPDVEKIIRANGGVPGEPWCGDFVAFCYLSAGAKSVVRSWAAVRFLEQLLTKVRNPARGHVVIFQWDGGDPDHTGLFDEWIDRKAGTFRTIEGNTGSSGAVSDSLKGDGVRRRERNMGQVSSFRRVVR